jgi:DNA-binding LacI/PurR family transcriptional regulator
LTNRARILSCGKGFLKRFSENLFWGKELTGAVNITDVAQRAGVSISTVSRVLNNSDYPIRPETRQKVLEAIEELRFRPNDVARSLLLKQTHTIGLIVPDISNPYYPELSLGVEATASEHGYAVIFCNTSRRPEKVEYYLDVLLQKRADGIIIAGGGTDLTQISQGTLRSDTKIALVGKHHLPFPSVQVDNFGAAREITSHLLHLGHRHIAFISGPPNLTSVQDRLAGYKASLEERGISEDNRLICEGDFGAESGYSATLSLLRGEPTPTAIFAANDRMAISAMAAAADVGLRVPNDLTVVGFDDIITASLVRPSLTTVALPAYEIGASAMRLMLRLLEGEECPKTVWLPTQLVIRQSSGPPPRVEKNEERG